MKKKSKFELINDELRKLEGVVVSNDYMDGPIGIKDGDIVEVTTFRASNKKVKEICEDIVSYKPKTNGQILYIYPYYATGFCYRAALKWRNK